MKRGGRGEKFLAALEGGNEPKKEKPNLRPRSTRSTRNIVNKSDRSSFVPDYVDAFDKGRWEELDAYLMKGNSKIQDLARTANASDVPGPAAAVTTLEEVAGTTSASDVPGPSVAVTTLEEVAVTASASDGPCRAADVTTLEKVAGTTSASDVPCPAADVTTLEEVAVTASASDVPCPAADVTTLEKVAGTTSASDVPGPSAAVTTLEEVAVTASASDVPCPAADVTTLEEVAVTASASDVPCPAADVTTLEKVAGTTSASDVPGPSGAVTTLEEVAVTASASDVPCPAADVTTLEEVGANAKASYVIDDDNSSISDFSSGSDDIYSPGSLLGSSDDDSDEENEVPSTCTKVQKLPGFEALTCRKPLMNFPDNKVNLSMAAITKDAFSNEASSSQPINGFNASNSVRDVPLSNSVELKKPQKKGSKRIYDKKQACLYCRKLFCKLPQHFEHSHSDKHEVADYLSFPSGSKERVNKIRKLRNKGNFIHNSDVLKNNNGFLIVVRRSSNDLSYTKYLPCQYCFAFMHRRKLWRHAVTCPDRYDKQTNSKKSAISNGYLLLPLSKNASELFNDTILKDMHEGEEKTLIKNDSTLCTLGSKQAIKHKFLPQQKNHISFKLRLLARLVLHLKKNQNITNRVISSADHLVLKENFYTVSTAVNEISIDVGKPSLGKKLGHHLKKCAMIVRNRCIVDGNDVLRRNVEDFLVLYNDEWDGLVSGPATDVLNRRRYKKKTEIPSTDDIMKLNKHILNKEEKFISNNFNSCTYTEVAKVVLTHVVVFNRRRVGEVSLMEVESFNDRITAAEPQGEIEKMLSQSEANMFSKLEILYLRGKKGAKVDCLLTPNMVKCMQYLADNRESNGVLKENIYLFCLPYSRHCMRGSDAIKEMADQSGAKIPSQLTSTTLRKHISTVSQLLNLSDNNLNALCKHMGHNPSVHRQYYQMPEEMILKTQISKILVTLEQGNMVMHQGKKLNEFDVSIDNNTINRSPQSSSDSEDLESIAETVSLNESKSPGYKSRLSEKQNVVSQDDSRNCSDSDSPDQNSFKKRKLTPQSSSKKKTVGKSKEAKKSWSKEEIGILNDFFAEEIMLGVRPPTKKRCEECMKTFPEFQGIGNYLKIKWRVNAIIQEKKQKYSLNK